MATSEGIDSMGLLRQTSETFIGQTEIALWLSVGNGQLNLTGKFLHRTCNFSLLAQRDFRNAVCLLQCCTPIIVTSSGVFSYRLGNCL